MAITTVEEVVTKINELSDADREELLRRLGEPLNREAKPSGSKKNGRSQKKNIDPNIEWIKNNKHNYYGNYVALKDGLLIAFGRTLKDADLAAKAKGYKFSELLFHYIFPKDYIPFGGW